MADFDIAFLETIKAESGYVDDSQGLCGETYKGIIRKLYPGWHGWVIVDLMKKSSNFPGNLDKNTALQAQIKEFYAINYWDKIQGDLISNQAIAEAIFDFAVNAGPIASTKLAQMAVQMEANGVMDKKTLEKINTDDPRAFLAVFSLHKIGLYVSICEKRQENKKFFFGWIKRTLEVL